VALSTDGVHAVTSCTDGTHRVLSSVQGKAATGTKSYKDSPTLDDAREPVVQAEFIDLVNRQSNEVGSHIVGISTDGEGRLYKWEDEVVVRNYFRGTAARHDDSPFICMATMGTNDVGNNGVAKRVCRRPMVPSRCSIPPPPLAVRFVPFPLHRRS